MRLYQLAAFVAVGTLGACIFITDACGCVLPSPAALAIGTVTVAAGAPAAGVTVLASAWRPPCDPMPIGLLPSGETTSDAQGAFRLVFIAPTEGLHCARVTARLGAAEATRVVTVQARPDVGAGTDHLDSVRVDLTLP
jgi:hypothetical protein